MDNLLDLLKTFGSFAAGVENDMRRFWRFLEGASCTSSCVFVAWDAAGTSFLIVLGFDGRIDSLTCSVGAREAAGAEIGAGA